MLAKFTGWQLEANCYEEKGQSEEAVNHSEEDDAGRRKKRGGG